MDLKELQMIMVSKDFKNFLELYEMKEEIYTPKWFEIEEMKDKILEQYGLDDLYGLKVNEDDEDDEDDDDYNYNFKLKAGRNPAYAINKITLKKETKFKNNFRIWVSFYLDKKSRRIM